MIFNTINYYQGMYMSIDIIITFFQMFAALYMSISYFRINNKVLKSIDKQLISNFNKSKRNSLKKIAKYNIISKSENDKLVCKSIIPFIIYIFIVLVVAFLYTTQLFNNLHIVLLICFLLFIIALINFVITLNNFIIPKLDILKLKISLLYHRSIYLLSNTSYVAATGFIFLCCSFILDLINKSKIFNSTIINFIEIVSYFGLMYGVSILGIILKKYFEFKNNKIIL